MAGIAEIQEAIRVLPQEEFAQLRDWLEAVDWERWDKDLEDDVKAGRLDFLLEEAMEAEDLRPLDEL